MGAAQRQKMGTLTTDVGKGETHEKVAEKLMISPAAVKRSLKIIEVAHPLIEGVPATNVQQ